MLRLILLFTFTLIGVQSWGYASIPSIEYSFDAAEYFIIDENIESHVQINRMNQGQTTVFNK